MNEYSAGDQGGSEAELPRMTLPEHLDELRRRLVISALTVFIAMILAFVFKDEIWGFVQQPYVDALIASGVDADKVEALIVLDPGEAFFQILKLCFLAGAVLMAPVVIWQLWGFVSAGLYDNEKKHVRVFFPVSLVLFGLGVIVAYKILIPFGLRFLIGFGESVGVKTQFRMESYLSTCLTMVFGMGFVFLLPLVMLFLQAVDIVSRETFRKGWRWAVIASLIAGMFLTDPSPTTQLMMAIPVVGLYFIGIWGGRFVGENRERFRWYKAWPLAIGMAAFIAMIVYAEELNDMAAQIFAP